MKYLIFIASLLIIGCSKNTTELPSSCKKAFAFSEKYTADTVLIKIDTIWKTDALCGHWIDTIRKQKPVWFSYVNCPLPIPSMPQFQLERILYKIL